ncbi:DNA adenine methylase [Tenacibaculum sp. nBUS_03]|uniref:DNA adenine methylase n=1 Tax=Tenacibaculum sp. nBUS_03 TaxID=3395320 RepID=UPI003EB7C39E
MYIKHTSAPLPFQGQKRNFIKQFKEALKGFPENAIYVDLFGGSGLLSHTVKTEKPNAKVIYNDFDNFKERLESIPLTNEIISKLKPILIDLNKNSKIPICLKSKVLKIIKSYDNIGFVDYITLSSNLLFSMKYVQSFKDLEKQTFYNNLRKSVYKNNGYLQNVEFIHDDYKSVFEKYRKHDNIVFLVVSSISKHRLFNL